MRNWQEPAAPGHVPGHHDTRLLGREHQAALQQEARRPWVTCPEADCDTVAEVIDRYTLPSTDGPVRMVRSRCLSRHILDWIDDA